MNRIRALVTRHPLITFFVLAYALSWGLISLISLSLAFALLGLLGPALAALGVTALTEGRAGVMALLRRVVQWRVAWRWYGVAVGLPVLLALTVLGLHHLLGGVLNEEPGDPLALLALLALLVVGEELGWRGYALPRLQARFGGLGASLLLGVLWAAWHLANTRIPGLAYYGWGFPAFLPYVAAMTVLFTWLANHTQGSVLLAWLFHAAINVAGSRFALGDPVRQWWLSAAVFGVAALLVLFVAGPNLIDQCKASAEADEALPASR